jgi:hypothetical protein
MYHVYPWHPEHPPNLDFRFTDFATREFMCMVCGEVVDAFTNYTGQCLCQCTFCRGWTVHSTASFTNLDKETTRAAQR